MSLSNFVVTAGKAEGHTFAASITDAELVADLKVWLENRGLKVIVKDHSAQRDKAQNAEGAD